MFARHVYSWIACLLLLSSGLVQAESARHEQTVTDLVYGTSLYRYFQDDPLAAITEIEAGKFRQRFQHQADDAELLLGSLMYDYGLAEESQQIFEAMLGGEDTPVEVLDRVWFNLSLLHYDQGNWEQSLSLISNIGETLPQYREAQMLNVLANLHIGKREFALAENAVLRIKQNNSWRYFSAYNLAVGFNRQGQVEKSRQWLNQIAELNTDDQELMTLRDSAYLSLGLISLQQSQNDRAIEELSKIRLSAPFTSRGLLGSGWAWSRKGDQDQAISYWLNLTEGDEADIATQEAHLGIAHALEQQDKKSQAIRYYEKAAQKFDEQLSTLQVLEGSINRGDLIVALHSQGLVNDQERFELLLESTVSPIVPYLYELFASKEFQQQVVNYRELLTIQNSLLAWQNELPAFQLMLDERRVSFELKKPLLQQTTDFEQLKQLTQQRDLLAQQVEQIETEQNAAALADEDESDYLLQLEQIEQLLSQLETSRDVSEEREQFRVLRGLLEYDLAIKFPPRLWAVKSELIQLDRALDMASQSANSLRAASSRNDQQLNDLAFRIEGQEDTVNAHLAQLNDLILRQEQEINRYALEEITQRKRDLLQLRLSARYSVARLLDELNDEKGAEK